MSRLAHELEITPQSRFEEFVYQAKLKGSETYRTEIKGSGGFEYVNQVSQLIELSNKINVHLLIYLFGEQPGLHLAEKYVEGGRNLLTFLNRIDNEYQFFILYELKTNKDLFAHT